MQLEAEAKKTAGKALSFAYEELRKYCAKVIGEECQIELLCTGEGTDDGYEIDVKEGRGIIAGSNSRSVLMGVYGLFYELGCRFIRPGEGGEVLVKRQKRECTVKKVFKPKYRHRGVCSEGAISLENVVDMIDWLPKMGMNSYFMQFTDGHLFFEKWYKHVGSTVLKPEDYSAEKSAMLYKKAAEEIKKRGLVFHAVGHGWTTEPLGYVTYGDSHSTDADIKPQHRQLFAQVGGRRGFFKAPGDTQLCYGNPKAIDMITDAVADYLKGHPEVDVLHFWLADNINNHCECELCRDTLPSDFYVKMLNILDEKLSSLKIEAKIVFLVYCDLLFAPKKERLKNPDRFIMMFAPIARNYFSPLYTEKNLSYKGEPQKYARNKNRHPKDGGEFLYYLREWQKTARCDSFAFDYHLMTFPYGGDPSFMRISRTLYEDMDRLGEAGLNGNVSCQLQRISMPTFLPMYVMAKRLCGTEQSFDGLKDEYMAGAFGQQGEKVSRLLETAESFFVSDEIRKLTKNEDTIIACERFLSDFSRQEGQITYSDEDPSINLSLKILKFFAGVIKRFVKILILKEKGEEYLSQKGELFKYLDESELEYQPYVDMLFFKQGLESWIA